MSEIIGTNSPWKKFPENIIRFASQFEGADSDFERLIGFLLLDVGVENLLKAYVLDSNLEYKNKNESTKGIIKKDSLPNSINTLNFGKIRFHNLVEATRETAYLRITDNEFKSVENFHEIRNIIYHEARKTFPSKQDFDEYLSLAKSLLQKLLGIEWESPDQSDKKSFPPDPEFNVEKALYKSVGPHETRAHFEDLQRDISVAIVLLRPQYATRIFEEKLKELWLNFADTIRSSPLSHLVEPELIKEFHSLTGQNISQARTILEICDDVTYLQLVVLLTAMGHDVNSEMKKYLEFRDYSRGGIDKNKEVTQNDIEKYHEYLSWVFTMQEKLNSFIEEKSSGS
jgi:hypothetical protein